MSISANDRRPAEDAPSPRLLLQNAHAAMQQGNWPLALAHWKKCVGDFDSEKQPEWQASYARTLIKLKRFDEASRVLDTLVRNHPGFSPGHAETALLAFEQENWDLAVQRWESCIRDFADDIQPWWLHQYANCLSRLENSAAAEHALLRFIREFPEHQAGYAYLARIAQQKGDWAQAVERWEACLQVPNGEINPAWQAAHAHALLQSGRLDKAARILEPLGQQYPQDPTINARLALLALRQENWPLAEQRWADCIRRFDDGTHPEWHKQHARALINLEQYTQAIGILEGVEQGSPTDEYCLNLLAKAYYLNQNMARCLQYAQRLIQAHPTKDNGFFWAEKSLVKLGRFKEAADYYSKRPGKPLRPRNPDSLPDHFPPQLVLPPIQGNGNDYGFIEQRLEAFLATGEALRLPVSIIVPVYNRARLLANTLAALSRQTYPRHLMEVVVADDGSSDDLMAVLQKYRSLLNLAYVRQEDRGFRAAAVRNLAVRIAKHPHLIFLDCDVTPLPSLVKGYMQYFHVSDQVILMNLRDFVSSDRYCDDDILNNPELVRQFPGPVHDIPQASLQTSDGRIFDQREPILLKTNNLKDDIFPFRYLASGNMAMPKSAYDKAGGFDERFQAWGGEDTEFAYRLSNYGYYLIPVAEARAFHQEALPTLGESQVDREQGRAITLPHLIQIYPLSEERQHHNGKIYAVPKVSVYIPAHNAAEFIREAVDSALAQTYTDLEVVICDDGSTDDTLSVLETHYSNNRRVRWFSQPHGGIAAATNKAVAACHGMYIGQLDADDVLEPTAVTSMTALLDTSNVGLAYSRLVQTDRTGKPFRESNTREFSREHLLTAMICTAFRMFRKRDWYRTSGCDESLKNAVDYDLALKFSEICHIGYLPEVTYRYRIHGANTSLVNRGCQEDNHLIAINKSLSRMGLAYAWRAVPGPLDQKRLVRFQRLQAHVGIKPGQNSAPHALEDCRTTGFIAGSGRSGTTWLLELVNFDQSQRVLFEPFRKEDVHLSEGWHTHQYLQPGNRSKKFLETARNILEAEIENRWIDAHNIGSIGHRWLIKDIRANLFLKWLQVNFPRVPYILLLRHPCAVARSRCHLKWPSPLDSFLSQADLMDEHLSECKALMQSTRDPFESHVISWCVENLIPLRQFSPGELLVVFYEHLCLHPEREIKRIFSWLGRSFTPGVVAASKKPSALSRPHSAVLNGVDLLNHWKSDVSIRQIRRAMAICTQFGMHHIYGEDSLPLVDNGQVLCL